jgi:alpha-ribazole phosphatase
VQTARAIAAALGTPSIDLDDRWAETDFGLAEGLAFDELALAAPDLARRLTAGDTDVDWPDGERAASLRDRVEAAWRDVTSHDRAAVVVTHGGPMRVAIALETGHSPASVAIPEPGGIWWPASDAPSAWDGVRTAG